MGERKIILLWLGFRISFVVLLLLAYITTHVIFGFQIPTYNAQILVIDLLKHTSK